MRIISGLWRGHRLRGLGGSRLRPTRDRVREAWMSAMGGRFDGAMVVDLFSGSGALGLEALSRGADHAILVERSRTALSVLESNVRLLGAEDRCSIVRADVFRYLDGARGPFNIRLSSTPGPFDLAFADPPYGSRDAERLVARYLQSPFAHELWLEHDGRGRLELPDGARTRRYGGTSLTVISASAAT